MSFIVTCTERDILRLSLFIENITDALTCSFQGGPGLFYIYVCLFKLIFNSASLCFINV